jgi:hypothetical protein
LRPWQFHLSVLHADERNCDWILVRIGRRLTFLRRIPG